MPEDSSGNDSFYYLVISDTAFYLKMGVNIGHEPILNGMQRDTVTHDFSKKIYASTRKYKVLVIKVRSHVDIEQHKTTSEIDIRPGVFIQSMRETTKAADV